jgi:two-component system, cell cycle sensor histidine kinase and response regulator CckA
MATSIPAPRLSALPHAPQHCVLLVDHDTTRLKLGRTRLRAAGFQVETATSTEEALSLLTLEPIDAVMSEMLDGGLDGFELCRRLRGDLDLDDVPVILLSAHFNGESERELAARAGASALLAPSPGFDDEIDILRAWLEGARPLVARALDASVYQEHLRSHARRVGRLVDKSRSAEERYRILFERAHTAIAVLSLDGVIVEVNQRASEIVGRPSEEIVGRHVRDFAPPGQQELLVEKFARAVAEPTGRAQEVPVLRRDGTTIFMEASVSTIVVGGRPLVLAIGEDVTRQLEASRALAAAEERYRSLVSRIPEVIWTAADDGAITFITPNVATVCGLSPEEMCDDRPFTGSERIHPEDRDRVASAFAALLENGAPFDVEYRWLRKDLGCVWLRNRCVAAYERDGGRHFEGMLSDVTEKRRLEDSLHQAQKMEAIGQLTGGIAHDFNNILGAILANAHFLLENLAEQDPRRDDAAEIKLGAERAAALTRQLLAFSRRQVMAPCIANLNTTVAGLEKMLRRLIGEDIEFHVVPGEALGSVRVDLGQIEQVIMNLVVNARDAMPRGGRLTIETTNVHVDDAFVHAGVVPVGAYVMLTVSDNGCGMDAETKRRIFEPFFTTKEVGKGTGLGLSTCYGIVKQSEGFISVSSTPGRGTVFAIYLPRVDASVAPPSRERPTRIDGCETILLVEDDAHMRSAVARMLSARGYRVLVARDGDEAIRLIDSRDTPVDLVVTDVIMPGMSGPQMVTEARSLEGVDVLFMSGYTDHAVLRDSALCDGLGLIHKPFTPLALAKRVRSILDSAAM